MLVILATWEAQIKMRGTVIGSRLGQKFHGIIWKIPNTKKRADGVVEVVEHLIITHEDPSSNPSTAKKEKERENIDKCWLRCLTITEFCKK
jgi:hypothetical protein